MAQRPKAAKVTTAKDKPAQRRLPPEERRQAIVEEAARFFAEVGFEGRTRALAERMGVTQALIYRYFPSKDSLIEEVFRTVFTDNWDPSWAAILTDRQRPWKIGWSISTGLIGAAAALSPCACSCAPIWTGSVTPSGIPCP